MNKKIDKLPNGQEIVDTISRSNEHLETIGDRSAYRVHLGALALTADKLADSQVESNRGYETNESRQYRLIGALPNWLRAEHNLSTRRKNMDRQEYVESMSSVIEFNHILREIIDTETYTRMTEVTGFVSEVLLSARVSGSTIKYATQSLVSVLDGMRHEIASESVLSDLPGVEDIRGADTIEEEMRGMDIIFTYEGTQLALDIKSTQRAADEANHKSRGSNYYAIWSGFTWDDFGDSLLPTKEQLIRKRPHFTNQLGRIVSRKLVFAN